MNAAELRLKETAELAAIRDELREELFRLRMQHYTGQLDKSSRLKDARRQIARVKTILRERELGEQA